MGKTKTTTTTKKSPRLTSYRGIPGVYVRHLAKGDSLTLRIQIDGVTKYRALAVSPTAPTDEIRRAADAARARMHTKELGDYIADYATAKDLAPRSLATLRQALRGFSLDDDANEKAATALQSSDYSRGTKHVYMGRISGFFQWLRDVQNVPVRNPIAGRKVPRASEARVYGMTRADVDALIAAIDADGTDEDRLYVRLLRFTCARCSTVYALTPADCTDDGRGGFYLRLYNVKCKRAYAVPIPVTDGETCALIRRRLARRTFWGSTSERALHERLLRRMKPMGASPHALRHYGAEELISKGVPLETVSRILDHAGIAITHAIYARQSQSVIDNAIAKLER